MARESRAGYNFSPDLKAKVRREQKNRCKLTGKREYLEIHHMLGIALARGYFPTADPQIFTQRENAVGLTVEIHKQLHEEMLRWPPEFTKVFVIGMYKYLRDIYKGKQAGV